MRVSFADAVRDAALAIDPLLQSECPCGVEIRLSDQVRKYGWDLTKQDAEVRRLLQVIGTEAGRDIHGQDCWTNIAADKIEAIFQQGKSVVITDCRFDNEVLALRRIAAWDNHPIKFIRISRPGVGPVNSHVSDSIINKLHADIEICNDGTEEELHANVLRALGIQ